MTSADDRHPDAAADTADTAAAGYDPSFLIVAIGASAGGLEAYRNFFAHMPADAGMAFVLVQHLAPDAHSMLATLIARSTRMQVAEAADGTRVEAGHVYVIAADTTLTIADGVLRVRSPAPPREHRWPIDTFFNALAEDQGECAVCVVLSGSGSDGARGLRAVKMHGGLTVAQAGFDHTAMSGMPANAAATGLVDHVLPAEDIPALLLAHRAHLHDTRDRKTADGARRDLSEHVQVIAALVRAQTGHDFSEYKQKTLVRRIQRRMQVLQLATVPEYITRLRKEPAEAEALFHELLIGVTEFFRDPEVFNALQAGALSALMARKSPRSTLRAWVAGCSTGEEVYSVAIALREAMGGVSDSPQVQIFGSDIDERAIAFARAGRYPKPLAGVSEQRQRLWFREDADGLTIAKSIREMCLFSVHSLIKDPPFSQLDLISCRNLLIYLDHEVQQRVLRAFHYALRPQGVLLLGASESLGRSRALFHPLDKTHRIYQKRDDIVPARPVFLRAPSVAGSERPRGGRTAAEIENDVEHGVRRILEKYTPAYVVIDGNHEVLRFSGDTGRYLAPAEGQASLNLFNLLHKGLRGVARAAVQKALATQRAVVQEGLSIPLHGEHQPLRLIAAPLTLGGNARDVCLVAFDEMDRAPLLPDALAVTGDTQVASLLRELESTRTQLQAATEQQETVTEELMSANEEYQSVNEELQSSNEELETSKEEMQSVNEELQVINAEIQSKNETLSRLNSDLQNLMDSSQIATLFLDTALRVTGFTSGVRTVFHLRDGDRGRPITDITARIHYPELRQDTEQMLRTLAPLERVIRGSHGVPTYLLRGRPYRTVDNVIDGAVLTFIDITEREEHQAQGARLAAIVENSHDAIIGYTGDGTITSWNHGAERVLGYAAGEIIGKSLARLLPVGAEDQWEALRAACLTTDRAIRLETTWQRSDGRAIVVDLACSPIAVDGATLLVGSTIARDVSERRGAERALRQSEARLAAILEQTSMGLAQTDFRGRFELVNPRFCALVDRRADALYRMRVQDLIHPDDRRPILAAVRRALVEHSHFDIEVRFLKPDGDIVWTRHSITALLDSDRKPQHMISAVLDISQQKRAQQHVELMLDELNHRVKNTLATVQAIALHTLARAPDLDSFRISFGARLLALSNTHNLLAADAWTGARLRDIVANELKPYLREDPHGADAAHASIEGEDVLLSPKYALALSMALHELATNASKYGALSVAGGRVAVRWQVRGDGERQRLNLHWTETGGPPVAPPTRQGFGTRLITEGLAFELNGEASLQHEKTGVSCVIDVPLVEGNG